MLRFRKEMGLVESLSFLIQVNHFFKNRCLSVFFRRGRGDPGRTREAGERGHTESLKIIKNAVNHVATMTSMALPG